MKKITIMKKLTFLLVFISMYGYAQTPITDANFKSAINTCLSTNPVDGMCSDSEYGGMSNWDVSNVTDMSNGFFGKTEFNGDISAWNVSNVTDMYRMFYNASSFNADISAWDVSKVTTMYRMFYNATLFNGDLSTWDVSNVTNMSQMLNDSGLSKENYDKLLLGWSKLDLQQGVEFGASDINYCNFEERQSIIDAFGWIITDGFIAADCKITITDANIQTAINTCLTTNPVDGLCSNSEYGPMPNWNVSNVTDMNRMFFNASSFNGDLSAWDVSNVTNMFGMFSGATSFNADISAWDVSKVTTMGNMFIGASSFNGDLSAWDVSNVTNMFGMFSGATSFNADISAWDVSKVTTMGNMFGATSSFNGDISTWDVSKVTTMNRMFYNATLFNGDLSTWDVSSVTDMGNMFYQATSFNGDIGSWDTSSVTNMEVMFFNATSFNADISAWDVRNLTDMQQMFSGATSFNADISAWDVSKVTTMNRMFFNATLFNGDLSTWDVSSVTDMGNMFYQATSFNGDIGSWDVSNVTNMSQMLNDSGLSKENYDKLLLGWSKLDLQLNVNFDAESVNYCNGLVAKQSIIDNFGWIITDAGADCPSNGITELFISEYAEGSGLNRAIEIVNLTSSNVNLSDYSIQKQHNGGPWVDDYPLGNTDIIPGDVFVIVHASTNNSLLIAAADKFGPQNNYGSPLNFNGNDAIGLFKNGELIDIIGEENNSSMHIDNITYRRKSTIIEPSATFITTQWETFPVNTFEGFGNHISTLSANNSVFESFKMFPNPAVNKLFFQGLSNSSKISIYDILGKLLLSKATSSEIDVNNLQSGIYIIKIKDEQKEIIQKFIKN